MFLLTKDEKLLIQGSITGSALTADEFATVALGSSSCWSDVNAVADELLSLGVKLKDSVTVSHLKLLNLPSMVCD